VKIAGVSTNFENSPTKGNTVRTKIGGASNGEVSNASLIGQKLQPNMFKNTTDSRIEINENS